MSGIQISGLLSNSAFDWKSVVDQLIQADSIPMNNLSKTKDANNQKITALDSLKTSLVDLQSSLQSIRSSDLFSSRTVSSDNSATTWKATSTKGAALGNYTFAVQSLATQARLAGRADIGGGLSATADVSGTTLANLNTATAATAGTFTVNGAQVTVALTDSLQDIFDKIGAATGGDVSASYNPATDKVSLSSQSGEVILGAANDTSNLLGVLKLANNAAATTTSTASLGVLKPAAKLANAGLRTALTGQDASGNGTFTVNGVTLSYNVNTDSLASLIAKINSSSAGVTATYDSANDRVSLVNKSTGDIGLAAADGGGNLLAALGLTTAAGGTFTHGLNAQFTVNGGPVLTSTSNTLDSSVHGISGLSVTVNSKTTETLTVESDTASMQTSIQDFVTKFNAVQSFIATNTKITTNGTNVTTSVLSDNREVQSWATQLQNLVFDPVAGLTGTVQRLDNLGIDFSSTTGQLTVKDGSKLANALGDHPEDVQAFFLNSSSGLVSKMYGYLTNIVASDADMQGNLTKKNSDIDTQVATMQSRLDNERTQLTNSFIAMLDAQQKAQSQTTTLTNAFFNNNNNNNSCWVARAVYGEANPRWWIFRYWLLHCAPGWFRRLYLRHGERFAAWLQDKPALRRAIRWWMDGRIATLRRA